MGVRERERERLREKPVMYTKKKRGKLSGRAALIFPNIFLVVMDRMLIGALLRHNNALASL